ncbi:MAG TPA: hypothetical protein GXZ21_11830 [Clostridiales bacterium]|jgi:predicted HAD superfamily hydrolase|nr:hypothetical protein [Clostridiales bacterium]
MYKDFLEYDLISLDIFDTLLLRAVSKPADIFKLVWKESKKKGISLLDISPTEFMKLRIECERRARNKADNREVNLREIYNELPKFVVSDLQQLIQIEVEIEQRYCYKNFDIYKLVEVLEQLGKTIVLLSDMYLSVNQIESILTYNEIDLNKFDSIIVSNEEGCSKQTGELYDVLFGRYPDVSKDRVLHIGDNKSSDFDQAKKKGIDSIHYYVIPDKLNSIYDYERIRHNIPQPELISLRKLASQSSFINKVDYNEEERIAYEIGASVVGPFMSHFVDGVCDQLERLHIDKVYPLMREGYLLGELLRSEIEYRNKKILVKPIYVSRKVTYIPSIEKINREEIENLIGARNLTIKEAIEMVGLSVEDFYEVSKFLDIPLKISHRYNVFNTTLKEYVIDKFSEIDNISHIEKFIQGQRSLLVDYLKQEIGDFENIATIDIGFFGRIQFWIEKALDLEGIKHNIKHFLAIGVIGDKLIDGLNMEGYYGSIGENMDLITTIHRTTDVLEKLISVTEGSTIGYIYNGVKVEPLKDKELPFKRITDIVFKGILDYQKYWIRFKEHKPNLVKRILTKRRESLMIIHRLIDMPKLEEVEFLMNLEGDTNFGTEYRKKLITDDNIRLMKEKGLDFIDKCNASYTYEDSNIVWPKGLITLGDEFYYVRRAIKNNANNETVKLMQEVLEDVVKQGIQEVALYGAGENGRQFYFMCKLYNVKVNCFIDRKESLWGTEKEGIKVMGLKEAIERGCDTFIITSLFSISEIRYYIELYFKKNKAVVFHV